MSFNEKRKDQRLCLKITALCKLNDKIVNCYVQDISPRGLRLELLTKPLPNSYIKIILETKPPLELLGKIKWINKDGLTYCCGVQFENLSQEQTAQLSQIIHDLFWKNFGG